MSATSYNFDAPDADVILRTCLRPGIMDFRVHKTVLSIASTLFQDMFSLPQPPQSATGGTNLPIIPVSEPPEIFEPFLRLIYPIEPPAIDSLQLVDDLFRLAEKYMTSGVHAKLKQILVSPSFLSNDPIWVYAIACRADLNGEAELAIRHTFNIDLIRDISHAHLQTMSTETYNRLLASHVARRVELISALNRVFFPPWDHDGCSCGYRDWFYARLFKDISLVIWEAPPFLDRWRLDSCLSRLTNVPESVCGLESSCRVSSQTISRYFTSILDEIGKLG